jgi:hypothetical protein
MLCISFVFLYQTKNPAWTLSAKVAVTGVLVETRPRFSDQVRANQKGPPSVSQRPKTRITENKPKSGNP